jgi:hypothetical protein
MQKDVKESKAKNPHAVALGRLGGCVRGSCKARTSEQARRAAKIRWAKYKNACQKG